MRSPAFHIRSTGALLCLSLFPSVIFAATPQPASPQPKTADAVIAADEGWSKAEETGDAAYVDQLLLPNYRSVNANGSVHDKAAILSSTRKNVGSSARSAADQRWREAHPMGTVAVLQGDTAILTFYLKPLGPEKGVMSSDVFTYVDGRWHALYSQHTDVGK